MNVNKARRDNAVFCVNRSAGAHVVKIAGVSNADNLAVAYRHAAARPVVARAVDDTTVGDEDISDFGFIDARAADSKQHEQNSTASGESRRRLVLHGCFFRIFGFGICANDKRVIVRRSAVN